MGGWRGPSEVPLPLAILHRRLAGPVVAPGLAERVAEGQDALLGARALLVATGASEGRVEAVLSDRVQQRDRLQGVARCPRSGLLRDPPAPDRVLDRGHDQALAELGHAPVAK